MSEEEENTKGFKVNDKRRFDEEGTEKEASTETSTEKPTSPPQEDPGFEMKEEQAPPMQELNFSSFVVSLATQALMQLGEMPVPEGVNIPKDKDAAKQTIDILSILSHKTTGNLDDSEAKLMEEILHNLRMAFVKA